MMEEFVEGLCDDDGDGVINFSWDTKQTGITVELEDIFGKTVVASFYKKDLLKLMRKVMKECK
jgi:hypothetical protein